MEVASPPVSRPHRGLLLFLAVASGVSVATIYYNQPLLLEITRTFHVSSTRGGIIAVATQLGYAAGILFFVPLGDVLERRRLILQLFGAVSLALLAAGLAPTFWILAVASAAIGITAAVTHILVPMAPEFAGPNERGRAIGTLMSGLLLGVLLGRVASGAVAELVGWRGVFLLAGLLTLAFVPLLKRQMPLMPPPDPIGYRTALRSLWDLITQEPILREASAISFLGFGAFIAFWTNLAYFLGSPHYRLGAGVAGAFGLLGAGGAVVASIAGRVADRYGTRFSLTLALALLTGGYVLLWVFGYHLAGLVAGVIVIDAGQQTMQISNQTRIFALSPTARARINTVYMILFFLGGATGSALSTMAWSRWQWSGVCGWGLGMLGLAWLRHARGQGRRAEA